MFYNVSLPHFIELYKAISTDIARINLIWSEGWRIGICRSDGHQIYPFNRLERLYLMARKTNARKNRNFNSFEFINFRFSAAEKKELEKWLSSPPEVLLKCVHQTLQDDNKLSISWDVKNDCFVGALAGKEDSLNENKCITVRGSTWERAQFAVCYVHELVFKGGVWENEEDDSII